MKKQDNTPLDLEQLLATVEHAGRDQRRQERLAAMIDELAAAEGSGHPADGNGRRPLRWWLPRVAAAACLLFFIVTSVRIWYIPAGQPAEGALVAEATAPQPISNPLPEVAPDAPQPPTAAATRRHTPRPAAVPQKAPAEAYLAEETLAPDTESATKDMPLAEEPDTLATALPEPTPLAEAEPEPVPAAEPTPQPRPEQPQAQEVPRRQSFWRSLFRPAEPDLMDGTTLAFNIL